MANIEKVIQVLEEMQSEKIIGKFAGLIHLQEQCYQLFKIREENGGRLIPERWHKWYKARFES